MGCLVDAHIVARYHDKNTTNSTKLSEQENDHTLYCLITLLGNHPAHIKLLCGTKLLREEILQRFTCPFQIYEKLSIECLCNYVSSQQWHELDPGFFHSILVDFIIAGEPLSFSE